MAKIERIAETAYFVPAYSEQTIVVAFQPTISNQIIAAEEAHIALRLHRPEPIADEPDSID